MSERYLDDQPYKPLYVGNVHDDDGPTIDSFDVEVDAPVEPKDMPVVAGTPVTPSHRPRPLNRLRTGYQTVTNTMDPIQILPGDPYRQNVRVDVISATATDKVRVGDDLGKLQDPTLSPSGMSKYITPVIPFANDEFTGPLWVSAKDCAGSVIVTWSAASGPIEEGRS